MSTTKIRYTFLLLSVFLLAYLIPLGYRSLVIPDETRYAEIPREMIDTGNWVTPHLNGLKYFEKPVLGYWAHAGSILMFGENNFAVRFPSALAVALSALFIFSLTRRKLLTTGEEDNFPAFLAVLTFMTCGGVFAIGNTAVLDNLFSLFVTASIATFFLASEEPAGSRRERVFLLIAGLACGLAFLTKGFLAFVIPGLAISSYLIWQRRYMDLIRMSWLPALSALAIALPWCVMIHIKEPDFWYQFFWKEHIRRFISNKAQHKESFWYLFLFAPIMFMPWTFMIPAALPGIKKGLFEKSTRSNLLKYCVCWLVLPFIFLSLSRGKLLTYILPCFPPFAILIAIGLAQIFKKNEKNRCFQGGVALCCIIAGLALIGFICLELFGFKGFKPYQELWEVLIITAGVTSLILLCVFSFISNSGKNKALLFGVAPCLCLFLVHYIIPKQVEDGKCPGKFIVKHMNNISKNDIVITDKQSVSALCWYLKRDDIYIYGVPGELAYGFDHSNEKYRLLNPQSLEELINHNQGKVVLICRVKSLSRKRWKGTLPVAAIKDQSSPKGYLFWRY